MQRAFCLPVALGLIGASDCSAEEIFVTIQNVTGDRMSIVRDGSGGGGPGRRGGAAMGRRGSRSMANQAVIVMVPSDAKITSAMRERRTFEFRVGVELAGGLRNRIFENLQQPLSARIVTEGSRIIQVNVITTDSDINQSNSDPTSGAAVIAVRPKQPPLLKK